MDHKELEEGNKLSLDFTKLKKVADCPEDLLPAVAQDADTGEVLIVGYANELALKTTFKENMATFWSTSRNELWLWVRNMWKNSPGFRCMTDSNGESRTGCYYRRIKNSNELEFK